jgi:hypothetical protein
MGGIRSITDCLVWRGPSLIRARVDRGGVTDDVLAEDRFIPPKGDDAQPCAPYIGPWVRRDAPVRALSASALTDNLRGAPGGPADPNGTSGSPPPARPMAQRVTARLDATGARRGSGRAGALGISRLPFVPAGSPHIEAEGSPSGVIDSFHAWSSRHAAWSWVEDGFDTGSVRTREARGPIVLGVSRLHIPPGRGAPSSGGTVGTPSGVIDQSPPVVKGTRGVVGSRARKNWKRMALQGVLVMTEGWS